MIASACGWLNLAAARSEDRVATRDFLAEAHTAADRLGADANHFWTAFGPTNVAIHQVATAMELGDVQVAVVQTAKVYASAEDLAAKTGRRLKPPPRRPPIRCKPTSFSTPRFGCIAG